MTVRRTVAVIVAILILPTTIVNGQLERPVRTFPQFVGTWTLDEAASTGRLRMAPLVVTIATTATHVTVTKRLRAASDGASNSPPPEVYRLDGVETDHPDPNNLFTMERTHRFTLVADMLALTVKERRRGGNGAFTQVTEAYVVDGDVLTVHRQLTSITASGEILVMQEPTNNNRHTFIYRRTQ